MSTALVWFRDDLRVQDHEGLHRAMARFDRVVACYVLDSNATDTDNWGFPIVGKHRMAFLLESIADLSSNLERIHVPLLLFEGSPSTVLRELVADENVDTIFAQKSLIGPDLAVEEEILENLGSEVKFEFYYGQFLMHPSDLPFSLADFPESFSVFRQEVERKCLPRELIDTVPPGRLDDDTETFVQHRNGDQEQRGIDPRSAFPFRGGETFGNYRINDYLWDSKRLTRYRETKDGLTGPEYSTKFSPWLANGSLSPRQIYTELKRFEKKVVQNNSTYWLFLMMLWRDYYKYVALTNSETFFDITGFAQREYKYASDPDAVASWIRGDTDHDFVNANMIELRTTGWMSSRGRLAVSSYFCRELQQDWRIGAAWFASQLIDLDPALNWGNWMTVAGVGDDPDSHVWLDANSQSERYDPDGSYRATWLSEPTLAEDARSKDGLLRDGQ